MKIVKDTKIREKYMDGFERVRQGVSVKPDTVVIHATAGGDTYNYMLAPGKARVADYRDGIGLFHYLIERDGKTLEIIDPERWTFHSSSSWYMENGEKVHRDLYTIGIELVNLRPMNAGTFVDEQYAALMDLIFGTIMPTYPITTILSHSRCYEKYLKKRKEVPCPGPNFDWSKLESALVANGYVYHHNAGAESYWNIRRP